MDQQRNHPTKQDKVAQPRPHRATSSRREEYNTFTDKERKREEIKQSTIGGF